MSLPAWWNARTNIGNDAGSLPSRAGSRHRTRPCGGFFCWSRQKMTTSQFVSAVYNNVFARAPDAAGLAYWTQQLDSEAITRQGMIVEFSESDEFKARSDTPITTFQQNCGLAT